MRRNFYDLFYDFFDFQLWHELRGVIVLLLVAVILFSFLVRDAKKNIKATSEMELIAMETVNGGVTGKIYGDFFLGCGYVNGNIKDGAPQYRMLVKTKRGIKVFIINEDRFQDIYFHTISSNETPKVKYTMYYSKLEPASGDDHFLRDWSSIEVYLYMKSINRNIEIK
jgi:hypothetical protein